MQVTLLWSLCVLSFTTVPVESANTVNVSSPHDRVKVNETILSRRKRFIVFPDGSSFQLVFCTQNHGYLQVGDIVWFGQTAALAWELPTDPKMFYLFKDYKVPGPQSRKDDKHIYYLDEDGKVIGKQPYRRKPIVNPAFAKRSVNNIKTKDDAIMKALTIKRMHRMQENSNFLSSLDEDSVNFHRQGRKTLYSKIEKILATFGWEGKECVLRMLCEAGKQKKEQGSFMEEIFRATFTFPSTTGCRNQHLEEFDIAYLYTKDCIQSFPKCQNVDVK